MSSSDEISESVPLLLTSGEKVIKSHFLASERALNTLIFGKLFLTNRRLVFYRSKPRSLFLPPKEFVPTMLYKQMFLENITDIRMIKRAGVMLRVQGNTGERMVVHFERSKKESIPIINDWIVSIKKEIDVLVLPSLQQREKVGAKDKLKSKDISSRWYSREELEEEIVSLQKNIPNIFVDDIKALLSENKLEEANQLLSERKSDYTRFLELNKEMKDIDIKLAKLSSKLAEGEITSDAYETANDNLVRRKKDVEEGLWKLQNKIFREKYEKPF